MEHHIAGWGYDFYLLVLMHTSCADWEKRSEIRLSLYLFLCDYFVVTCNKLTSFILRTNYVFCQSSKL